MNNSSSSFNIGDPNVTQQAGDVRAFAAGMET